VIDLLTIGQDMVDTLGAYFLNFIIIASLAFYRNYFFQIFNKLFFKNYFTNKNNLSFLNYFHLFLNNLNKTVVNIFKKMPFSSKSKKKFK
jgi:hypothetical protein